MTREEQIIQYVEKKYRELASPQGELTTEGKGYLIGMGDILRFIQTLPKDQPQGLDEAVFSYENNLWENEGYKETGYAPQDVADSFKAGATWRDQQIPKLPDNLDKAAEEYKKNHAINSYWLDGEYIEESTPINEVFKAGAEWMAGQGVSFNTEITWIDRLVLNDWPTDLLDGFKSGDKIIVTIRKKED